MKERIGSEAKRLMDLLQERGMWFFESAEVARMGGRSLEANEKIIRRLERAGWVVRLERGLYALAGEELNPLAVGRELAGGEGYYISHGSAMEVWGMGKMRNDPRPLSDPQPGLPPERGKEALRGGKEVPAAEVIVTLTDVRRMRARTVMGTRYRFVKDNLIAARKLENRRPRPEHWRLVEVEVAPGELVWVSDPEWTVLSGLARPDLCGGMEGAARAAWNWRERLDLGKLVDYANHIRNRTAVRRLGYVLEALGLQTEESEFVLGLSVFSSYGRLEPGLPGKGEWYRKWRLDVNAEIRKKT